MKNAIPTAYIVYAKDKENEREPIIAVTASEDAIRPIIDFYSEMDPSTEIWWEVQEVINGTEMRHSVYLAVQNDLIDPVVAGIYAEKEGALDYVARERSKGLLTNRFVLNVEIGWDPNKSLIKMTYF